jgi:hypothetical protein
MPRYKVEVTMETVVQANSVEEALSKAPPAPSNGQWTVVDNDPYWAYLNGLNEGEE